MPTGYTHDVQMGAVTTLKEYAMQCARAFGACIDMKEEPHDAQIPERFDPRTDYHNEKIAEAEAQRSRLIHLSPEQCADEAALEFKHTLQNWEHRREQRKLHKKRYEEMVEKVKAWNPPQILHGLRDFMVAQLYSSINYDCSDTFDDPPVLMSAADWLEKQQKSIAWDIRYHSKERATEIHRTEERNLWLATLRESLK